AAKRAAEKIRRFGRYANVLNVYMEEFPLVSDWTVLTNTPNVVVVPFFISDGLHSYEDIPVLLGIAEARHGEPVPGQKGSTSSAGRKGDEIFRRGPYKIDNRSLFYASSIGTDPRVADIIVEQATAAGGANDYRFIPVYKIVKDEFVILAGTGKEPPAYPRFPISQGLCGAALESGKAIVVGDVHKDKRYLPAFHSTQSEIIVPMKDEQKHIVGMLDAESDKLNAFSNEDKQFLERAAGLIAHCLA